MVISYAVGNGDMFSIRHDSDNFTIIDCSISVEKREDLLEFLKIQGKDKGCSRFISTHPDHDHIMGLKYLDEQLPINNFYCVANNATKSDETDDFKHYRELRDGTKAFKISKDCTRKWMNQSNNERGGAGIQILWPNVNNTDFKAALTATMNGDSPNNISPIIMYCVGEISFLWMGDLETGFMELIKDDVDWPDIDILFAPHHGRDSGKIPMDILNAIDPSIIIIGEAPSRNLNYYGPYNTITQNSAGDIAFECVENTVHIYVGSENYSVTFLENYGATTYKNYIGTLVV